MPLLTAYDQVAILRYLEGAGGFQKPHFQEYSPCGQQKRSAAEVSSWPSCPVARAARLTCLRQDGGLVQGHVLKYYRRVLHVLVQGSGQCLPDQAQVAGGREDDATVDAVIHQVAVRGLGVDVCGAGALVPPLRRGEATPPPGPPASQGLTDLIDSGRRTAGAIGEVLSSRHIPGLAVVPLDVGGDEGGAPGSRELHRWV